MFLGKYFHCALEWLWIALLMSLNICVLASRSCKYMCTSYKLKKEGKKKRKLEVGEVEEKLVGALRGVFHDNLRSIHSYIDKMYLTHLGLEMRPHLFSLDLFDTSVSFLSRNIFCVQIFVFYVKQLSFDYDIKFSIKKIFLFFWIVTSSSQCRYKCLTLRRS